MPGPERSPAIDAVLTTCPYSPCRSRIGKNVRMPWITPTSLTPRIHTQPERVTSQASPPTDTPALLQTTCTAPKASSVRCASASTSDAFDTSVGTARTRAPELASARSAAASAPCSTSASTTFIPAAANRSASARPIPLAAPVTTATRSRNSCMPGRYATAAGESRGPTRSCGPGSRDRAALLEARDRLPVVAELEEHLFGVLAALGRGAGRPPRRAGEVDRRGDAGHRAALGCRHVDDRAAGAHLRVGDHLRRGLHRCPPEPHAVEDRAPLGERAGGEDRVQQADQLGGVVPAVAHGGEARIVEPLRPLDGAHEVGPVTLPLQAQEEEPAAVARAVGADHGVRRRRARDRRRLEPEPQRRVRVPAEHEDADAQQRGGDELAAAGALAGEERRGDRAGERHARGVIAHGAALIRRLAAGGGERGRDPRARPERADVVGGPVAVRARLAVAGHPAVDE